MTSDELKAAAKQIVTDRAVFFMATVEGTTPRVRPMTCIHADGFRVWTASHKDTGKMRQLSRNNTVECCFLDARNRQVRLRGTVTILETEEAWAGIPVSPQFTPMVEDPNWVLLRIDPQEIRVVQDWSLDYHTIPVE